MEYWTDNELTEIGLKVIAENENLNHLADPCCRIAYQWCEKAKKSKGRLVFADTELVKDKLKLFIPYDFLITFYLPNCMYLDEDRMKRVMYHELLHVGFEVPDGYSILPHDLEDFRDVVDKWGTDWIRKDKSAD